MGPSIAKAKHHEDDNLDGSKENIQGDSSTSKQLQPLFKVYGKNSYEGLLGFGGRRDARAPPIPPLDPSLPQSVSELYGVVIKNFCNCEANQKRRAKEEANLGHNSKMIKIKIVINPKQTASSQSKGKVPSLL